MHTGVSEIPVPLHCAFALKQGSQNGRLADAYVRAYLVCMQAALSYLLSCQCTAADIGIHVAALLASALDYKPSHACAAVGVV
jgi:hypothetical protein